MPAAFDEKETEAAWKQLESGIAVYSDFLTDPSPAMKSEFFLWRRTEPTTKKCKNRKKLKLKRRICSEVTVNSLGNPYSESRRRKRKGCGSEDLQKRKDLSLE